MATLKYDEGDEQTPDGTQGAPGMTGPALYSPNQPAQSTPLDSAGARQPTTTATPDPASAPPTTFAQMQDAGYARPPMPDSASSSAPAPYQPPTSTPGGLSIATDDVRRAALLADGLDPNTPSDPNAAAANLIPTNTPQFSAPTPYTATPDPVPSMPTLSAPTIPGQVPYVDPGYLTTPDPGIPYTPPLAPTSGPYSGINPPANVPSIPSPSSAASAAAVPTTAQIQAMTPAQQQAAMAALVSKYSGGTDIGGGSTAYNPEYAMTNEEMKAYEQLKGLTDPNSSAAYKALLMDPGYGQQYAPGSSTAAASATLAANPKPYAPTVGPEEYLQGGTYTDGSGNPIGTQGATGMVPTAPAAAPSTPAPTGFTPGGPTDTGVPSSGVGPTLTPNTPPTSDGTPLPALPPTQIAGPSTSPPASGAPVGATSTSTPAGTPTATGVPSTSATPGSTDILSLLTGGANGTGAGSAVQDATQAKTLDLLNNPSPYGSQDVKDLYSWESGNIDDQYKLKQDALDEEMARRGLGDSTNKAGRLNDLNIGQRSAKEALAENLDQNYASTLGNYQTGAVNAGNTVGTTAQNNNQSWLAQLMGYGQNAFNNDLATNSQNQTATSSYQNFILQMLGLGYSPTG